MNKLFCQPKFLIWTLCFALLAVRIAGAHWHLCFDGSEPPAMVHVGDNATDHHAHEDDSVQHNDVDLNLADNGLLKLLGKNLASALAIVALFVLMLPTRRTTPIPYRAKYFAAASYHHTPQPRAPPL